MTPAEELAAVKANGKRALKTTNLSSSKRAPNSYPWQCGVKEARRMLGLTLKDVSAGVGMSVAGLWQIEQGLDPMLTTARKLAAFFGMTVEQLWPQRADGVEAYDDRR